MTLFKNKYRVESTRLRTWDYASAGWYFVTICTHEREEFFGNVVGANVQLSAIGEIAQQSWANIPNHSDRAALDGFVVMPNHVHGIVIIEKAVETRHGASLQTSISNQFGPLKRGSLQAIINAYKAAVTRWCRHNGHDVFAWQPRFYEHIIRNEEDLARIRQYIRDNPARWTSDRNNANNLWM